MNPGSLAPESSLLAQLGHEQVWTESWPRGQGLGQDPEALPALVLNFNIGIVTASA